MTFKFPAHIQSIIDERARWRTQESSRELRDLELRVEALAMPSDCYVCEREGVIHFESSTPLPDQLMTQIKDLATDLIPWRKGPFNFFGLEIDAEWRSDYKWERLKNQIYQGRDLTRARILDVGCNNGYFMFQLYAKGARQVLGIDPVSFNEVQFKFLQKLSGAQGLQYEMLGVEHVGDLPKQFDLILSMGVLYHHRHPIEQLKMLKSALKKNGELILESIVIPSKESIALFPEDRYAKMKNVWFVPSVSCLENMLLRSKFKDVELLHFGKTTVEEQRLTPWCPAPRQSLAEFLDPDNDELTIEGYPAPYRAIFKARVS